MRDAVAILAVVSFLSALLFHLALVVGLFRRKPRVRGAIALLITPLAPYWGMEAGMRGLAIGWIASVFAFAVARALSWL